MEAAMYGTTPEAIFRKRRAVTSYWVEQLNNTLTDDDMERKW